MNSELLLYLPLFNPDGIAWPSSMLSPSALMLEIRPPLPGDDSSRSITPTIPLVWLALMLLLQPWLVGCGCGACGHGADCTGATPWPWCLLLRLSCSTAARKYDEPGCSGVLFPVTRLTYSGAAW